MALSSLKDYQKTGRDFLAARKRALLADDMRVGKTWQAIAAAEKVGAKRVRIICPAGAVGVWTATYRKLAPHRKVVTSLDGVDAGEHVEVFSYDTARSHLTLFLSKPDVDVLIIDESHFAKNPKAQRTKMVFGTRKLGWKTNYLWCLSGTPAPNDASELWPLARAFGLTRLGHQAWIERYCVTDWDGKPKGTNPTRIPELRRILAPAILRRLKKDVGLDKPVVEPMYVEPDTTFIETMWPLHHIKFSERAAEQEKHLRKTLAGLSPEQALAYLETNAENFSLLRRYTSLLKVPALIEAVKFDLDNGLANKLVVFAYHREPITALRTMLDSYGARALTGGATGEKRDALIKGFRTYKSRKVLLGQIIAAGTAIDLSCAHQGFMLERDWVPGNNVQALDRMSGPGQDKTVTIRDLIIPGSVDELVQATLARKEQELALLFD